MKEVEREARRESLMCAGKSIGNKDVRYTRRMKPAPYQFDHNDEFRIPPSFVRCHCTYGRYSQLVKSAPGSALDGAEYEIVKPCGVCAGSPLPGWFPIYYTPEEYRNWIRRENDLPEWKLPDDRAVLIRFNNGSWALDEYSYAKNNYIDGEIIIIATEAGKPSETDNE